MRNLIILTLIIVLSIHSCTTEAPEFDFTVSLKNESENVFTVVAINDKDEIVFEQILNTMESSENCTYRSEIFGGFQCEIDSISVVFENGKGYACDLRSNNIGGEFCFSDSRSPLVSINGYRNLGNNRYEFVITEEDFNNAHELPE